MQNSFRPSINSPFWVMACLVLLALALYGRALGFEYVWDDNSIFFGTVASLSKSNSFFSTLSAPFMGNMEYFRPLAVMTFYWDVCIAGYNPYFSHGVNLAFFIANTLLVFSLGKCIAEKTGRNFPVRIGFLAALLYVTHPAMTEATLWISGRFDLLVTLFILSASLLYVSGCTEKVKTLGVPLIVLLGLFCKETAALFPLAAFCLWMAVSPPQGKEGFYQRLWRENRGVIIGIFAVFLVYLVLRLQAEGDSYTQQLVLMDERYYREKPLFWAVESLRFYLGQSFLPFPVISAQHPFDYALAARVMPGFLAYPLLLAFLSGLFFCAIRKKSPSAWLFIAGLSYLLLVLHVVPLRLGNSMTADRYLTTALAFWAIAVALIPYGRILAFPAVTRVFSSMRFLSAHRLTGLLLGLWLLSSAFMTSLAVPVWKNSLSLWGWNYTLYPENDFVVQKFMSSVFSANRPELLDERLLKKFQDAPPNPVYGSFLLMKRDPATLGYLERLIASKKEFHLHKDAVLFEAMKREKYAVADERRTIPTISAYSYSLYSEATLLFKKDPEKALELDSIARQYAGIIHDERDIESWLGYRRVAYLYVLGRFEEADALKEKINSLVKGGQSQEFNRLTASILAYYCKHSDKVSCEPFLSKGLISKEMIH